MASTPAGFRHCKLGDVVMLKRGYDLPHRARVDGDIPIVSSSGVTGFHNQAKVDGPGVVTGRYGTLGEVFYIEQNFWPLNTALYVRDFKGNNPRFVAYFLQTLGLGTKNTAGAVPGVNRNVLHQMPVVIPNPEIQTRIADILSAYDDLIANNNRRMALLEESIHLLYREWFVRLRFPGHERLKIVDGVPEGWSLGTLGDIAGDVRRIIHPTDVEPGTPYVGLEHIPRESFILTSWGVSDEVSSSKHTFDHREILFGKIRPYFHKVVFAPVSGICSSDAIVIHPHKPAQFGLTLAVTSSIPFVAYASKTAKEGSKMPRANWEVMTQYPVLIPPETILNEFNTFVLDIARQIENLIFSNRKLRVARDMLLPRLMNGDLIV